MAIKALSKIAPEWFTPDDEKDSDRPTRFKLRPLTPVERESVMEFMSTGGLGVPPKNFGQVLRYGLTDWENFDDDKGKALKFNIANLNRIPADVRIDLTNEILIRSNVSEEEEKN